MRLKPLFLFIGIFLLSDFCHAQSTGLEKVEQSLLNIHDSLAYVNALNRVAMLSYEKNIDSTFYYAREAREIAKRRGTGGEQPFGLGLYISKQIIEAHHGKIGFKSEPGKGTEFFVELPFAVLGA